MKKFNSYTPDIIDPDADNPYGTFVDEGGGESGSPVLAAFMNTVKALLEKVMSEAGITYDDAVDTVTSCQSWEAFKALFVDLVAAQTIAGIKTFSSIPVLPSSNPTNDNQATRKAYVDGLTDALQLLVDALDSDKAENAISITASNGLTGGGNLTANRTISGVNASTGAKGVVQLNNTRTSTSTSQAATANAVKLNKDDIDQNASDISDNIDQGVKTTDSPTFDVVIARGTVIKGSSPLSDPSFNCLDRAFTYGIGTLQSGIFGELDSYVPSVGDSCPCRGEILTVGHPAFFKRVSSTSITFFDVDGITGLYTIENISSPTIYRIGLVLTELV